MSLDPTTRTLYEHLRTHRPDAHELLTSIDAQLADLHARGVLLSQTRIAVLRSVYDEAILSRVVEEARPREIDPTRVVRGDEPFAAATERIEEARREIAGGALPRKGRFRL